jgi:transposase
MQARYLEIHHKRRERLIAMRKKAEQEGEYRVARRLQAVILNSQGHSSGEVALLLDSPRSRVSQWLQNFQTYGEEGLLEGHRSGRPCGLDEKQKVILSAIIESGPVAHGLDVGIWTSPMLVRIIQEEFGLSYHPGHIRKMLHRLGFSVQRPRRVLARADATAQNHWRRYTYPRIKKKPSAKKGL